MSRPRRENYSRKSYDPRRAFGSANYLNTVTGGGLTLPRTGLAMLIRRDPATGELLPDSIGLSANALWDALPSYMRSHYLSDRDTKLPDATIVANIQASGFLNVGGGLHGSASKGYAQYQDGTSTAILDKAARYYRENYGWPTDIKSLVIASGGGLASPVGTTVAYSAAAGNVPDGLGGVQASTSAPVSKDGYGGFPAYTNKCTCRKANPTNLTNISKAGDAAAVLSVVDDSVAIAAGIAAGLDELKSCISGMVYKLDNSLGTIAATASISGAANTSAHSLSVYARSTAQWVLQFNSGEGATAFNTAAYSRCFKQNVSPTITGRVLQIYVPAGAVVYFILPQLVESIYLFPTISDGNAAAVSVVSTVGTTTGNGVSVPLTGSDAATALSGINTVISRITCAASSANITAAHNIITANETAAGLMFLDSGGVMKSTDGTNTATVTISGGFARGDILLCIEQVNAAGDQFRVGYEKNASGTITWGSWATYDGSFNPGTNLRALLDNSAPTWLSGFEVCAGSLSDANCLLRGRLLL